MNGTPFLEIYSRAITEFKDPDIKNLFKSNQLLFCEVMYNFLKNAINLFVTPLGAAIRVKNNSSPIRIDGEFIGDGVTNKFQLGEILPIYIEDLVICTGFVNGEIKDCVYDHNTNSVIFSEIPLENSNIETIVYFTGIFNNELYDQESYILSQWLVACWAESVGNNKLDIERLLGDNDFKLTSNSSTTTSKVLWNTVTRETAQKRMNKYAWDSKIMRIYK